MCLAEDRVKPTVTGTELTAELREAAQQLLDRCNQFESADLPISLGEQSAGNGPGSWFLVYEQGVLIGLGSLPGDPEPEASVMVHPALRRRGVGSALVDAIRAECEQRGLPGCLLVTNEVAESGVAFVSALELPRTHSEYRLQFDRAAAVQARPRIEGLALRPAIRDDKTTMVDILAASFGDPTDEATSHVERGLAERTRRFYLAELDRVPIGMLRAGEWDGAGDITAFAVLPSHQGRGYGRQMLRDAVELLLAEGWESISIEVATDNDRALELYQSCGFQVTNKYGYYRLSASSKP
jgi:ribosomal protein S18 acetylase RimI-like enzyme